MSEQITHFPVALGLIISAHLLSRFTAKMLGELNCYLVLMVKNDFSGQK